MDDNKNEIEAELNVTQSCSFSDHQSTAMNFARDRSTAVITGRNQAFKLPSIVSLLDIYFTDMISSSFQASAFKVFTNADSVYNIQRIFVIICRNANFFIGSYVPTRFFIV